MSSAHGDDHNFFRIHFLWNPCLLRSRKAKSDCILRIGRSCLIPRRGEIVGPQHQLRADLPKCVLCAERGLLLFSFRPSGRIAALSAGGCGLSGLPGCRDTQWPIMKLKLDLATLRFWCEKRTGGFQGTGTARSVYSPCLYKSTRCSVDGSVLGVVPLLAGPVQFWSAVAEESPPVGNRAAP